MEGGNLRCANARGGVPVLRHAQAGRERVVSRLPVRVVRAVRSLL